MRLAMTYLLSYFLTANGGRVLGGSVREISILEKIKQINRLAAFSMTTVFLGDFSENPWEGSFRRKSRCLSVYRFFFLLFLKRRWFFLLLFWSLFVFLFWEQSWTLRVWSKEENISCSIINIMKQNKSTFYIHRL